VKLVPYRLLSTDSRKKMAALLIKTLVVARNGGTY
jgi:hypothetical protein